VRWGRPVVALAAAAALGASTGCSVWPLDLDGEREFRILSSAMEPTLHCAQPAAGCLAETADVVEAAPEERYERGDIVVFETLQRTQRLCGAGGLFVKRIVGLPRERVAIRPDGAVFVNGRRLDESEYIEPERRLGPAGRWSVGRNRYFLLGDNRSQSCDSRVWGSLPLENIIGSVVAIDRPSGRIELERDED
jgi:signal peptidase I